MWASYSYHTLQKGLTDQATVMHLFENLMHKLPDDVLELFLVQSWLIWHQRNWVVHGGILQEPRTLNARASNFLEEFKEAQSQLTIPISIGLSHL